MATQLVQSITGKQETGKQETGKANNLTSNRVVKSVQSTPFQTTSNATTAKGENIETTENAKIYVINFENDMGYVILSGDKRAPEILVFQETGNYDLSSSETAKFTINRYVNAARV